MWEGISGLITLAVLIIKAWADHANDLQKVIDDKDKEIDSLNDADSIMRGSQ